MRKVFISHPFKNNPELNQLRVEEITSELKHRDDILLVSPLHLFSMYETEKDGARMFIMDICFDLIESCDEVWFYIYGKMSDGQKKEYEYAKFQNKIIKMIYRERD